MDILHQLTLEESLFALSEHAFCWLNQGTCTPAIVMGSYNDPHTLLNLTQIAKDGIPVIKRYTGGGTVYVDNNTYLMSFILNGIPSPAPTQHVQVQHHDKKTTVGPREIMAWSHEFLHPIFSDALQLPSFEVRDHMDYVIGIGDTQENALKIGGNAQKISRSRFVHHTSFLWDYDVRAMQHYLLVPELRKQPSYRRNRTHADFVVALKRHCNAGMTMQDLDDLFAHRVVEYFENVMGLTVQHVSMELVRDQLEHEFKKQYDAKQIEHTQRRVAKLESKGAKVSENDRRVRTSADVHLRTAVINEQLFGTAQPTQRTTFTQNNIS